MSNMISGALCAMFFFVGFHFAQMNMQKQAIDHKAAYFHPETGAFTWREQTECVMIGGEQFTAGGARHFGGEK